MKNKLIDLNNHLFAQLERLSDETIKPEELEKEIHRTDSMIKISGQILEVAQTSIRAAKLVAEYGGEYQKMLPETGSTPAEKINPVSQNLRKVR